MSTTMLTDDELKTIAAISGTGDILKLLRMVEGATIRACAVMCHEKHMEKRAMLTDDDTGTWHEGIADGWQLASQELRRLGRGH